MHFLLTHFLPLSVRFAQGFASLELRWGGKEGQIGAGAGRKGEKSAGNSGLDFCRHATDAECEARQGGIRKNILGQALLKHIYEAACSFYFFVFGNLGCSR